MSDLKIEANRISQEKKEIDKRLNNKKIETSNPYVSTQSRIKDKSDELSLSFNGVKVGHGSKASTDPQFYMDEKPQTAERARKSRAHRMSVNIDPSEKSEKQRNDYLKSLLNDEQQQIYDEDLLRQNQTVPIE
jgi:hypothetical protein